MHGSHLSNRSMHIEINLGDVAKTKESWKKSNTAAIFGE